MATNPDCYPNPTFRSGGVSWPLTAQGALDMNSNTIDNAGDISAAETNGPAILNENATTPGNPTLCPDRADLTTGIGHNNNGLSLIRDGVSYMDAGRSGTIYAYQAIRGSSSSNHAMVRYHITCTDTTPVFNPHVDSTVAGIGGSSGSVTMIGGGANVVHVNATGLGFYATAPIAQQTGVAVSAAGIHAACVALGLFTA